jgi:hypothetical protein
LVSFELRPVDVAFMVILQQNLARLKRFAVAVGLAPARLGPNLFKTSGFLANYGSKAQIE